MSIKPEINELNEINIEIKRLSGQLSVLRLRKKVVEKSVVTYLESKEQPGVKFNNTAIVVETKTKRLTKKKNERDIDALRILSEYGINDPKKVLNDILETRKGTEENVQKLTFKKLK